MNQPLKVNIIGSGNVATFLGKQFVKHGIHVSSVYSKQQINAKELSEIIKSCAVESLHELDKEADIFIVAVNDSSIQDVVNQLNIDRLVVHTSGMTPLSVLSQKFKRAGVFYPLQSISKQSDVQIKDVPFFLEANNESDLNMLQQLASQIGASYKDANTEQRQYLHLAAVFVNNFGNHLFQIGQQILERKQLNFDLLKPLIMETAHKMNALKPIEAQTGPAVRDDQTSIQKHLELLNDFPEFIELYKLMTQSIHKNLP